MIRLFLCLILLFSFIQPIFSAQCISYQEEQKLLYMSYNDFDQSSKGWRQYSNSNCYHEVGELIDKYIKVNKQELNDWQWIGLSWHAGQLFAFNNEYEIAKIRFVQSINPNEAVNSPIRWNDYVQATISFLDNDMTKLRYYRDNIANGPEFNGVKTNLDVVDRLIKYFGQSYSFAYERSLAVDNAV